MRHDRSSQGGWDSEGRFPAVLAPVAGLRMTVAGIRVSAPALCCELPRLATASELKLPPLPAVREVSAASGNRLFEYAAAELTRAIGLLSSRGSRFHTGVHQARKSIRRVRATLALGMPALGPGAQLLDRALRRVNRGLSTLRDAQALIATLDLLLGVASTPEMLSVLRRARRLAARCRAQRARDTLAADPQLRDRRALLETLQAALPALHWQAVTVADADMAMQASVSRAEKAGARALATGRDSDWHRWRRCVRRLTQQHRALGEAGLHPPLHEKHGKRLATLLGEAQDCALLRDLCGKRSIFAPADRRVLRALSDDEQARVRARVAKIIEPPADGPPDPPENSDAAP